MSRPVETAVADAFRNEWGQIVATLIRVTGDWDLAEECAQDAFTAALQRWALDGVPHRPGAWLTTAARHRAVDVLRRRAVGAAKLSEVVAMNIVLPPTIVDDDIPDDRLRLIFTCCHPALAVESQVALALRTLLGLTTGEIARAFLVSESTLTKRLVRARQKIRNAGIPYRVPPAHLLPERTPAVLAALYLLFNEGYSATTGADLLRPDLCQEAIRLARLLIELMPDEPEAVGLVALMLLHDARRHARLDPDGDLIVLEDQDRSLWSAAQIAEGTALLQRVLRRGRPGPYQVQAAIAACHAEAATAANTDWKQIAALYAQLRRLVATPVVELNHAVALGMAYGPAAGLDMIHHLEAAGTLAGYYLLPAARADLQRRLGRHAASALAYRDALALTHIDAERRYLRRRLEEAEASAQRI
jgi:RNA polymerase sigma-70 factor, ECF subfamily